jgi:hypothetical protein
VTQKAKTVNPKPISDFTEEKKNPKRKKAIKKEEHKEEEEVEEVEEVAVTTWKKEEEEELMRVVSNYDSTLLNWDTVSKEVKSREVTPEQCKEKYMILLKIKENQKEKTKSVKEKVLDDEDEEEYLENKLNNSKGKKYFI